MKKAFTLVEMLVVIGIIGILAAVLLGTFSGGTESARAARCLSNLRNLTAAVHSYAMAEGFYPLAGSIEQIKIGANGSGGYSNTYYERPGWISWYSDGAYARNSKSTHRSKSWVVSMYSQDEDARTYALTNGALWKYLSGSREVYVCPTHARTKKALKPAWSYVMNSEFGYTSSYSGSPYDSSYCGCYYSNLHNADRTLLFAEIPFADIGITASESTTGEDCDCVLDYKSNETLGFNHRVGKYVSANIAYADGHCEKLAYPKAGMSETQLSDLTHWLCQGHDIGFDGRTYQDLQPGKEY